MKAENEQDFAWWRLDRAVPRLVSGLVMAPALLVGWLSVAGLAFGLPWWRQWLPLPSMAGAYAMLCGLAFLAQAAAPPPGVMCRRAGCTGPGGGRPGSVRPVAGSRAGGSGRPHDRRHGDGRRPPGRPGVSLPVALRRSGVVVRAPGPQACVARRRSGQGGQPGRPAADGPAQRAPRGLVRPAAAGRRRDTAAACAPPAAHAAARLAVQWRRQGRRHRSRLGADGRRDAGVLAAVRLRLLRVGRVHDGPPVLPGHGPASLAAPALPGGRACPRGAAAGRRRLPVPSHRAAEPSCPRGAGRGGRAVPYRARAGSPSPGRGARRRGLGRATGGGLRCRGRRAGAGAGPLAAHRLRTARRGGRGPADAGSGPGGRGRRCLVLGGRAGAVQPQRVPRRQLGPARRRRHRRQRNRVGPCPLRAASRRAHRTSKKMYRPGDSTGISAASATRPTCPSGAVRAAAPTVSSRRGRPGSACGSAMPWSSSTTARNSPPPTAWPTSPRSWSARRSAGPVSPGHVPARGIRSL